MIKKQRFGVEIEFTGITRRKAANIVAKELNSSSSNPTDNCYKTRTITDSKGRDWKVMRDSSINTMKSDRTYAESGEYSVELVTPPLNYEDIELLQNVVRKLRESGAITNSSCGIHIHIDGANHTPESLKRLINFTVSRQDLIHEALEIGARGDRWCKKLNAKLLQDVKSNRALTNSSLEQIWYSASNDGYMSGIDHSHYNSTRYHGINLHSYFSKGTVEFRLFNSTLHAGKIKAYIQFCLALSAWSITSGDKVVFRSMNGYTAEQKVTIMRNILTQRLGLFGDEFKTCRLHLMTPLKKNAEQVRAA